MASKVLNGLSLILNISTERPDGSKPEGTHSNILPFPPFQLSLSHLLWRPKTVYFKQLVFWQSIRNDCNIHHMALLLGNLFLQAFSLKHSSICGRENSAQVKNLQKLGNPNIVSELKTNKTQTSTTPNVERKRIFQNVCNEQLNVHTHTHASLTPCSWLQSPHSTLPTHLREYPCHTAHA